MFKKSLSILLTLILILGALTVMPLTASARTADTAGTAAGRLSLQGVMKKFPEGTYWNHQLKSGSGVRALPDDNNDPDKTTNHPCYEHGKNVPVGEYKCNQFNGGMQCAGFANKIATDIYGTGYLSWKTYNVKNCKPGDVITYRHVSVYSGRVSSHTFMVIGREGNTIRIGECNFDRHCMITWSRYSNVSNYVGDKHTVCYCAPKSLPIYPLDTPVLTKLKNTANGMTLSWKAVDGAAKYRVFYMGGSVKSWTALGNTEKTSYGFKKAVYQTKYSFTVRAINAKGKVASDYDRKGLTAVYTFAPVVTAVSKGGKITVSWNKISKAAKFRVWIKGGRYTKYTKWKDTANTAVNYTAGTPGVTYRFTVKCLDAKGKLISDYSDPVSAKFMLPAPSGIKAELTSQNTVKLRWKAVKGTVKYQVFVKQKDVDTSWQKLAAVKGTSYTHKNCIEGAEYAYTVRCIDANGKYISDYDKTGVSILIPAAEEASGETE